MTTNNYTGQNNQTQSDYFDNHNSEDTNNTRVLSEEERHGFDGVTIDEAGGEVHMDRSPDDPNTFNETYDEGYSRVKVVNLNASSWLTRIILIAVVAAIVAVIFIFGGVILTIVGIVFIIGTLISMIFGLF